MNEDDRKIHILLINDRHEDAEDIKDHLGKHMRLPWNLMHCISLKEAVPRINKADLVILELELEGLSSPKQIFSDVGDMVFETPIIALTGKSGDDHGLATYVMEMGAADTMIRGQFGHLVDAIEFALIRQKITTGTRQSSDRTLADSQAQDATLLQSAKDQATADLKESKEGRADDQEKSKQTLRMFMGDYSVDQKDK